MNGTCKDCKYWDQEDWTIDLNFGFCELAWYSQYDEGPAGYPAPHEAKSTLLKTGPDFGCNRFETK